jgi:hypothetical protein
MAPLLASCDAGSSATRDSAVESSATRADAAAIDASDAAIDASVAAIDASVEDGALSIDASRPEDVAETRDARAPGDARDAGVVADATVDVGSDGGPDDAAGDAGSAPWLPGPLTLNPLPPRSEQRALPGAGQGDPVWTSNNPEVFQGDGLLFGTGRASPARGGARLALARFGVYLHHINQSGGPRFVSLIVTNPNAAAVTVSARGSGYNQTETGGLGLGASPDFRVSDEWIQSRPTTVIPASSVAPSRPLLIWQKSVNNNAEIDGRFAIEASAPVLAYLVVTSTADLNEVVRWSVTDAPGIIARSGRPPPPFGREAGVYEFDTWRGSIRADVPAAPTRARIGWMVNTATGSGHPQVQAFRALMNYDDSAQEAVGMYGNV